LHRTHSHRAFGYCFKAIALLAINLVSAAALSAQYQPAPRVGGQGSLDSASQAPGPNTPTLRHRLAPVSPVPEDFSSLKITPGFLLSMEVFDTPEYSLELRVDSNGNVNLPLAGSVHLADLTLVEASGKIASALRDSKILNNPRVNLNVEEYTGTEITVLGEVHNPGRIEMLAPRHLDDVIAMAGGETEYAGKEIEIRHATGAEPRSALITYSRNANSHILSETVVRPGDTVTVRRAGIVYVLGAVNRPGGYVMQEDGELSVTQAIALAYGTTMPAAIGSMRVIRKTDDGGVKDMPIAYRDMVKGKAPPLWLEAEDVVYVPVSKTKLVLSSGLLNTAVAAAVIWNR
jgi:polysaccharide biosynthesis/export protein